MQKSEPKILTFDEICESQDYDHNHEFISYEDYQKLEQDYKDLENSMQCLQRSIINDEIETCGECDTLQDKVYHATRKVEELELKNKDLYEDLASNICGYCWDKMHDSEYERLKEANKVLVDGLKFYTQRLVFVNSFKNDVLVNCGAHATEALEQYEKIMGEK